MSSVYRDNSANDANRNHNKYLSEKLNLDNEEDSKSSENYKDEPNFKKITYKNEKHKEKEVVKEKVSAREIIDSEFYSDPSKYKYKM